MVLTFFVVGLLLVPALDLRGALLPSEEPGLRLAAGSLRLAVRMHVGLAELTLEALAGVT